MKTGIEQIAHERNEQIDKHKRTPQYDAENNSDYELTRAASILCAPDWGCNEEEDMVDHMPINWDREWCLKVLQKPYHERIVIAGALLAAEVDRLTIDPDHNR